MASDYFSFAMLLLLRFSLSMLFVRLHCFLLANCAMLANFEMYIIFLFILLAAVPNPCQETITGPQGTYSVCSKTVM